MFKMWPEGPANPIAPSAENLAAAKPATISIEFPYFGQPLHIPRTVVSTFDDKGIFCLLFVILIIYFLIYLFN